MIKSFQELGSYQLEGLSDSEKRKKFLETQTILPEEPSSNNEDADKYWEIVINLDLVNDKIEVKRGDELSAKKREQFFGFDLLGRRSKKIYFTCNNLYYHLLTVPQMLDYIDDKFAEDEYKEFYNFLLNIRDEFYDTSGKKSFLKIDKFEGSTANQLSEYLDGKEINHKNLRDAFEEYISKDILGSTRKNFVSNINIFSLKINDNYITETDYAAQYIDIIYYERQGRFFDESEPLVKSQALCGTCNTKKQITGKIDIPTKFYVTSSPYFFENLNKSNAYKSFGICQECYQEVMVGISKVEQDYFGRLFNSLRYYVVPKNIDSLEEQDQALKIVKDILADRPQKDEDHLQILMEIKKDFKMDFLFWRKDQAAFIVLDSINDVSYKDLKNIFRALRNINRNTFGNLAEVGNYRLYFNDLYWLLFPNRRSHRNPDPKLYRKEMLNLLDSIMKSKDIDYNYLLRKFMNIFHKRYFFNGKKNKIREVISHPLKMNLMLSWLSQATNLKGGYKVREGSSFTEIENKDIKEFFQIHSDTYEGNSYRQGLFLLGMLMNQVLKEQQKENKSANILDKLSFDGMPVRRVKKFTKDITEILNIYDKYNVNQVLHAQMIDRLQGIENSSLNKDEVVFYILSGLSFGRYLGHKYYNKKGAEK